MKQNLAIFLLLILTSCQTTKKIDSKIIPITLRPQFSVCYPLDGVLAAKFSQHQTQVGTGELVWSQKFRRDLEAQLVTSFGNSLASLKVKNTSDIQITNQVFKDLPKMELDGEKIMVDGYFSGLLISEIGCILSGKLPFEWQEQMIDFRQKGHETEIDFISADRNIHTKIIGPYSLCTRILTSYFFGLKKNELSICTEKSNLLRIAMKSGSEFELNLEEVEDGN